MIIFIMLFVLFVFLFGKKIYDQYFDDFAEGLIHFLLLILEIAASLVVVILMSLFANECIARENITYEIESTNSIVALKDNQNISGSFFIFGGYEDEDLYYYYAEETDIGIRTNKVLAKDAYIIYDNNNPRIEEIEAVKFKHWWNYIYAFPLDNYTKLYVPDGTVTSDYNIDLE